MKNSVKVLAPATVANIGPGYDTIGFAVEGIYEEIEVVRRDDDELVIQSIEGAELSKDPKKNVATIAAKALLDHVGEKTGFDFFIKKHFTPGSGLGSSASSAAGAVYAVNQLLQKSLSTPELLPFALVGEEFASKCYHADNVAPSLLGGCIAVRCYDTLDYFSLPIARELEVMIFRPKAQIKTAEAKSILPKNIDIPTARNQWGNLASLVHAFHTRDWKRLGDSIEDHIAEPVRKSLIPGYDEAKEIAKEYRSVGYNISGSGPSVFAFFTSDEDRIAAKEKIAEMYSRMGVSCDYYLTKMSDKGCRVVES